MSGETPYETAVVLSGLEATATIPERIAALSVAGFSHEAIAYAAGISRDTLHNWEGEKTTPSKKNVQHLEDVCYAARLLIEDGGMEPAAAAQWLTKENRAPGQFFSEKFVATPQYPILHALYENSAEALEKIGEVVANRS